LLHKKTKKEKEKRKQKRKHELVCKEEVSVKLLIMLSGGEVTSDALRLAKKSTN
jgi:hypothetical protein